MTERKMGQFFSPHPEKDNEEKIECGDAGPLLEDCIADLLRHHNIPLTLQRLAVARVLFARPVHLTADQILARAQAIFSDVSRATVYNSLKLFKEKGLVRELVVDPTRIIYDSNTSPHYHLYNADTGEMTDIPAGHMQIIGTTELPENVELDELDIIVRVRNKE
jgi:Fur family iron response transcriptional regulator